jgi:hypothetical protein
MPSDPDFWSRHPEVLPFLLDANLLIKPPTGDRENRDFRAVLTSIAGASHAKQRHVQAG